MHAKDLIKRNSITNYLELLLSLIQSGFTVTSALKSLENNRYTKIYTLKISQKITNSSSVSDAICGISKKLKGYKTMLLTAEETGDIASALDEIVYELKENDEDKRNLVGIAIYPLFVCILACTLSIALVFFGIPYINIIADINKNDFIKTIIIANSWLVFSILAVSFGNVYALQKYSFQYVIVRNLYYLNLNSIGMEDSLVVLLKDNSYSKEELKVISNILKGLRGGRSLSELCEYSGQFDEFCISWLYVAEKGGEIIKCLKMIRDHYRNKRKEIHKLVQQFLEPELLGICGIYVVILITGCIIPVFLSLGSKIL